MDFHRFIKELLSKITSNKAFLDILTDDESMALYEQAFTHKSIDPVNNYETLEFYGDAVLNSVSVIYVLKRFPNITDEGILTSMKHYVTEKPFFARMSRKLGFSQYIKILPIDEVLTQATSINEDVFEAFNGALFKRCEEKIFPNSGYGFVGNLVEILLEDEDIPQIKSTLQKPRAILKEVFEKNKFSTGHHGKDIFITTYEQRIVDGKERNINMARVMFQGRQIGYGEGFRSDDAKDIAARQALDYFKNEMGITPENSLEKLMKEKRAQVEPLLEKYKKYYPNIDFRFSTIYKKTKGTAIHTTAGPMTYAIVGYYELQPNGKYKLIDKESASTPEQAEEKILRRRL